MHLIMTGLFQGRWSDQIHEEWIRNLLINRPDIPKEKVRPNSNINGSSRS